MLPRMVSFNNAASDSYLDDNICESSSSRSNIRLHRHSIACLPSSSSSSDLSWFHGQMGKKEADKLLQQSTPGSFLVRQHDDSRYYISVTSLEGIQHHPIKKLGKQFFFTGKSFSSLSDLVSIFIEQGGEPIIFNPIYSKLSTNNKYDTTYYIACSMFDGDSSCSELSAIIGDILTILDKSDSEWVLAKNKRTGFLGYIPTTVLSPLVTGSDNVCNELYAHSCNVSEALIRMRITIGSFLVRPSSHGPNDWAILVNIGKDKVKKFLLRKANDTEGGWILAGRRFKSIQNVIERYCNFPIFDNVRLCHAIVSNPNDVCGHQTPSPVSDLSPDEELDETNNLHGSENGVTQLIAKVSALRKTREDKSWKSCFLTLCDDSQGCCELLISDDYEVRRLRGVFRLPFSIFYNLDESIFNQDGCFFLSQSDQNCPGVFICIQPFHMFAEWLCLLRPRILALQPNDVPIFNGFRFNLPEQPKISIFRIYIDKYRSDALKGEHAYSAQLSINAVKVCSTSLILPTAGRSSPSVVFDASFIIPFAPCTNASVQVTIVSHPKGKQVRPFGISPIMQMPPSTLTHFNFETGVSMRMSRNNITVLPEKEYFIVQEWIESCPVAFLEFVSDCLSTQERSSFSLALVCHFLPQPQKLVDILEALLMQLMSNSLSENILRQDSLVTSLLTQTLRTSAKSNMERSLNEKGLLSLKIADAHDIAAVVNCITKLCKTVDLVAQVLSIVKKVTMKRFPEESHVVRRALSSVLILRFANPILLAKYAGYPIGHTIAKGVQAVANSVCSKMVDQDDFEHIKTLRNFFDELPLSTPVLPLINSQSHHLPYDWLAIACHFMYIALSSGSKQYIPSVPDNIQRVIFAHKPQY